MRKRVLLLVNPASGVGASRSMTFDIIRLLTIRGCEVTVYPILPNYGLISETIIRKEHERFDVIACCGGDGTLNHVVGSMARFGIRKPIGYIPSGSTNDFARSLGITDNLDRNCAAIAGKNYLDYDIGRFNDSYFNYVAAFGAFTKVSYETDQAVKNAIGYAAYILGGILSLPESIGVRCHLKILHDGIEEEGDYVFGAVSNATSVGGIASLPIQKASLNDGVFEVMLISAPDNIQELGETLAGLASGDTSNRHIKIFTAREIKISHKEKTAWTLDGEYGGTHREVSISVCPGRVRILLPESQQQAVRDKGSDKITGK